MEETKAEYSTNVRLGNWYEAICLEEDEIQTFLKQRGENQLVIQKTRTLFSNFFKEIELDALSKHIHFGAVVQIIAARMKICNSTTGQSYQPALSIAINDRMIHQSQKISDKCEITVAPSVKPCARNTFIIMSHDKVDRTNEILKYGQPFSIQCVEDKEELVLYSVQKSADLSTMISSSYDCHDRGEINLPVGLCLKKNTGQGKILPSAYTRWKCMNANPDLRFETEGQHVESNTPLIITHVATNQNLAAENLQITTLFGQECLVSVHKYCDSHKREQWQNIWMIAIG